MNTLKRLKKLLNEALDTDVSSQLLRKPSFEELDNAKEEFSKQSDMVKEELKKLFEEAVDVTDYIDAPTPEAVIKELLSDESMWDILPPEAEALLVGPHDMVIVNTSGYNYMRYGLWVTGMNSE